MDWILYVKALHVVAVIAWMAGMLYLPRLFVYHADAEKGSIQSETFKIMERRLYRGITTPAMIAAYVFGLIMIWYGLVDWHAIWPWVKAVFVLALSGLHGMWGRFLRDFANDRSKTAMTKAVLYHGKCIFIAPRIHLDQSRRRNARLCERWELMAPRMGGFRKAVAQQNEWALTSGSHVDPDAVDVYVARFKLSHDAI